MRVKIHRLKYFLTFLILPLVCLFSPIEWASSQETDHCDTELLVSNENPLRYRQREERCEGQYIEQVASTALSVASLTRAFEKYDLNSDTPLRVEWSRFGNQEIRLRAHGIKWRKYYRMDSVRSAETTTFQWPTGVLSALNLPKNSIGIVGWTYQTFGSATEKVYLPLKVTQSQEPKVQGSYRLVLWPGVQLKEIYISLAMVDDDGRPTEYLQEGKPLGYGFYPAQRAIPVVLSGFENDGIYLVTMSATLQSGSDTTLRRLVYHSGS